MCGDTLSAWGYSTMMAAMIAAMDLADTPPALYIFTDWRMWSTLEDVIAVRGYGVRNMLVWDKGFIGPGNGFRAQHELIMVGTNRGNLWPNGKGTVAYGHSNVLHHSRAAPTAKRHPSQKPLSLLLEVLAGSEFANRIYDPVEAALGQLQRGLLTPARLLGNVYAGLWYNPPAKLNRTKWGDGIVLPRRVQNPSVAPSTKNSPEFRAVFISPILNFAWTLHPPSFIIWVSPGVASFGGFTTPGLWNPNRLRRRNLGCTGLYVRRRVRAV